MWKFGINRTNHMADGCAISLRNLYDNFVTNALHVARLSPSFPFDIVRFSNVLLTYQRQRRRTNARTKHDNFSIVG